MKSEIWKCNQCGNCCTNQIDGMDILQEEIHLFPKSSYEPHLGYGEKSNITVFVWRLKGIRCPLYDDNDGCTIYENRPLICKQFPYTRSGLDDHCTNVFYDIAYIPTPDTLQIMDEFDKQSYRGIYSIIEDKMRTSKLWQYKHFSWLPFDLTTKLIFHAMKK